MSFSTLVSHPPLLNDTNYPYWKVRMRAFIKAQDGRVWREILSGWSPPTEKGEDGTTKVKFELAWNIELEKLSSYNNKAFHAIFNGIGESFINFVSTCISAKEAWTILQT